MSDSFNFDIDKIANKALKQDKTSEIILANNPENPNTPSLQFFDKLTPQQQSAIQERTPQLVDQFLEDKNSLLDFGQEAVENVNITVNKILSEQKKLEIPQVDDILSQTNRELNGFVAKYKDAKPADLEEKPNFLQKLFRQGKNNLQEFYFDSQNIEKKMDGMAAAVVNQEEVLARNIVSAEMLIEENTNSIENLVGVIAFIESSQKEAGERAFQLQQEVASLDPAGIDYQVKSDQLAHLTEVVNMLEIQHTEYISRLYVAWATTPQMRNLVKVSTDMRQKLGMLRRNTIPTMKLSIAQLGILQQSVRSGMTADAITNANNAALELLAETSKEAIPALERTAQNPTMSVQAVTKLAESLVVQNQQIIQAIEDGRHKRAQLEQTIIESANSINDSVKLRDKAIIQSLLNQGVSAQKEIDQQPE
ncbi:MULTISPECIES: toxic anion resistance protein [unclassified Streptococcus]|uniref:toxic anion resistance protein n=1 Tax=unclassified Streptococcus TaxID=2608887 RepID=UPI001072D911|nr:MULTISPECIES: toxic anion resistance protein [unclassified Streptococcus]MBF0806449.1 toxic anion resistance protein [Streptococcus sp. 19428wA2_WM07]TFU27923.1 toxic anion resistance protein [Streptococcus sp. WM07]